MQPQYTTLHPYAKDITGQRFGRLTALGPVAYQRGDGQHWHCRCDCGRETITSGVKLRSGKTQSCGCVTAEKMRAKARHGMATTRLYKVWQSMKTRCTNPRSRVYDRYGGRGITICEQWLASFENFYADMGDPPTSKHTIDRVNNNGNYEPTNCRWATYTEQNRNRRKPKPHAVRA